MHRFFVRPRDIEGQFGKISGEDAHHIQRVLRLEAGDEIILCNSQGMDYHCVIRAVDKGLVQVSILNSSYSETEPHTKVTLLQGLPKASKMSTIIQKCVELGVYDILPISTIRAVARISDAKDAEKKALRWQKVAEEAAKQSRRGIIPRVHIPVSFKQAVTDCKADVKFILWEEEKQYSLRNSLQNLKLKPSTLAILIGPEGGLEESESELASHHGWVSVTLGRRILRTETAGMATLAAIMYHLEELE